MAALSDPKLEAFAQALLCNIAAFMPRSKAAEQAARTAGYTGKSLGPNARKRAQRKDVKARMVELAAPANEQARERIEATLDWTEQRLLSIAGPDLGADAIKVSDQIAALKALIEIRGWKAPEKRQVTVRSADELTDDELAAIAAGSGEETPVS